MEFILTNKIVFFLREFNDSHFVVFFSCYAKKKVPPPTLHEEKEVDYEDVPQQYVARPKQVRRIK
jgi:hypothetical protein